MFSPPISFIMSLKFGCATICVYMLGGGGNAVVISNLLACKRNDNENVE